VNPSERTSSSSGPGPGWSEPDAAVGSRSPGAAEQVWVRPLAAELAPEVAPEARRPGWIYSCGGACGADALATVPCHWPGLAPVQTEAASILSSCVYFLALCSLLHSASRFSHSRPVLRQALSIPLVCRLSRSGRGTPRLTVKLLRSIEKLVGGRHSAIYLP